MLPRQPSAALGGVGDAHTAELRRGGSGGEAKGGFGRLSARRGPGALFTLRASRRGRLEARGRETGRSVSRKHPTPEF